MKNKAGFTLVELMVVIGVIVILTIVSIPLLSSWQGRHSFSGAVRDVLLTLRQARLVAVEENETVVVTVNAAAGTYEAYVDDGGGDVTDLDLNGVPDKAQNGVLDAGERIVQDGTVPDTVRITAANFSGFTNFRFDNRGFPIDPAGALTDGTITLASDLGGTRQISLIRSGHSIIQ